MFVNIFVSTDFFAKMFRRGTLLVLLLLLSVSTVKAGTTDSGLVYYNNGSYIIITGYSGASGDVIIPNSIEGLAVYIIQSYAFRYTAITSVVIPDSVVSIGSQAFNGCTSLTSIEIGSGVTSIGDNAFNSCTNLSSIDVDSTNAYFSSLDGVLFNKGQTELILCPKGKVGSFAVPLTLTAVDAGVFADCNRLTSITIPSSITSIGTAAFKNCTSIPSITMPDSVTSIGDRIFQYCTSLTSVTFSEDIDSIGYGTFYGCTSLSSVTIPNSVTSIGEDAFYNCTSLASITVPDSVTSIDDDAFYNCINLSSVTLSSNLTTLGEEAFMNCTKLTSITIPDKVTSLAEGLFQSCTKLVSVIVGQDVNYIHAYVFYDCNALKGVYFKGDEPDYYTDLFSDDSQATVYYQSGTTGWGSTFYGRPTALWTYVETSPLSITKCTIAAGSGSKGDSISFSGTMSPTSDDFDDASSSSSANFVEFVISPEDTNYSKTVTFPVNSNTWKKGKFSYSGTENGIKKSFSYAVKTGKFAFAASNIDLSGLECPLTIDVTVSSFDALTDVNETVVNGIKTIPVSLLMGVKDSLWISKSKFTSRLGVISNVAVSGEFSIADVNTNLATSAFDVNLAGHIFTIPASQFKYTKGGKYTCSKVNTTNSSGVAAATFDFNKSTFILTIKNTSFSASGSADLIIDFADFSASDAVALP